MKQHIISALLFLMTSYAAIAQEVPAKQLQDPQLKSSPLNTEKTTYLNFGAEVRYQYFNFKNPDWGDAPADRDGYILSRFLGHADFHAGKHFRSFIQLQSSMADGQAESPSAVDRNPLEVHQAFIDINLPSGKDQSFIFRLGRQEMSYGSQRLVSVREGPNNRQSFDAVKLIYAAGKLKLDGFYSHYVQAKPGLFDDGFNKNTKFWGAYATISKLTFLNNIDLYYLGLQKASATFDEGSAKETRHSIGSRIWQTSGDWQYDLEGLYQFGKFGDSKISAWTASSNVSYTFNSAKLKPQLGLKTELIGGDKNYNDGKLNTFNPLFPRGAYFGLAALIGPSNLIDVHPYLSIALTKELKLSEDYDMFWRMNRNDGIYAVSGKLMYSGKNTISKKIGHQLGTALEYTPNKHLYLRGELTWFNAGDYLKETGAGKDILMVGTTIAYKF